MSSWRGGGLVVAVLAAIALGAALPARQSTLDITMFSGLTWRSIGPFRGGRTTVAVGVPSQPNTFFAGTANGGVWKTTDAGRAWRPVFDREPTGTVGSIAVARSNVNVVYAGTGEAPLDRRARRGQGLFRSNDGGQSWAPAGLADHYHLSAVAVDPANPDRVFVASTGSVFGPDRQRGILRSTNGGRSFEHVFFKDEDTGALDLAFDPSNASVLYSTLLQSRYSPLSGESESGAGTGVIKTADGGATWRPADSGLPTFRDDGLSRIRIAVSPSNASRLFAVVAARTRAGVYRSDDGGNSWTLAHASTALVQTNDESTTVAVDPTNPDAVYLTGPNAIRSSDGGRTFTMWRSDPSGGAYRSLWINPVQPTIVMLSGDRGAVVTVNGGETWSSAYNQPTGQFADVVTDTAFPYRVCGAERDGPPGCLPSRGAGGRISPSEWRSVSPVIGTAVAPDPQDPEIVYSGSVSRFDRRTGQLQDVRPATADEPPHLADGPLVFSADGRTLYFGADALWKGTAGPTWAVMSPDVSRENGSSRARISTIAPSAIDNRLVWIGTDNGSIQLTRDAGVSWTRTGPPAMTQPARVSSIEPSHFDTNTAYVTVEATSLDDERPYVFRTRDGGATWQRITAGLPVRATVHGIREDSFRRGLLFASTAQSVFVSFDDGERWQSMRLNLPPVPVTDLTIKDSDLVAATDGRGFWILDDITPFRQITGDLARARAFLFRPATAWRTPPLQPVDRSAHRDEPAAVNPPDGVAISYLLGPDTGATTVTVEIIETLTGDLVRHFSGDGTAGFHRVIWDLKYTPIGARTLWVMPGTYQVRLTAGSQVARQAVIVRLDPRVRTSVADLTTQFKLSRAVYERRRRLGVALERLQDTPADRQRATVLQRAAAETERVLDLLQQADARPTAAADAAAAAAIASADTALGSVE